jgi:hypothetical protein
MGNLEECIVEIAIREDEAGKAHEHLEQALYHFDKAQKPTRKQMVLDRLKTTELPNEPAETAEPPAEPITTSSPTGPETGTVTSDKQSTEEVNTASQPEQFSTETTVETETTAETETPRSTGQSSPEDHASVKPEATRSPRVTQSIAGTAQSAEMPSIAERETVTVTRKQRKSQFREEVHAAYEHRCAICGARRASPEGGYELEATHIKPVSDGGPDIVQNGIALCRLHHWAFDAG